jgi:L-aspartate oxidase
MWNYVGIVRNIKRLQLAKKHVKALFQEIEQHYKDYFVSQDMIELRNIALVSLLIIESALHRKETRGLHYLVDYPESQEKLAKNTRFRKKSGEWPGEVEFV